MDIEDRYNRADATSKSSKKGRKKPQMARQQNASIDSLRAKLKANGQSDCGKDLKRRKSK